MNLSCYVKSEGKREIFFLIFCLIICWLLREREREKESSFQRFQSCGTSNKKKMKAKNEGLVV